MSDSSVRTQLKYWAMLGTLQPVAIDLARVAVIRDAEFIDQYEAVGGLMGIGLAVRRGAESPDRSPRGS